MSSQIPLSETARAVSDSAIFDLTPIPFDADDVCPTCRSWRHARFDLCSNCLQVRAELSHPCATVIPITLYSRPSKLRNVLKYYKTDGADFLPDYPVYIGALIDRFLYENMATTEQAFGQHDAVCVVPSSQSREIHPLHKIIESCDHLPAPAMHLLKRGPGTVGRRVMADDAYVSCGDVSGMRVILFDDVFTTGSHCQSAASALHLAGAFVSAIVVVARRIDAEFNLTSEALWSRQKALPYSYSGSMDWFTRRQRFTNPGHN
jgi:predicted amidophosphoribosyltransferase